MVILLVLLFGLGTFLIGVGLGLIRNEDAEKQIAFLQNELKQATNKMK